MLSAQAAKNPDHVTASISEMSGFHINNLPGSHTSHPVKAINAAPRNAPAIPRNEIAPDTPAGTFLQLDIIRGLGLNPPISVAHVSAFTAASDAK